MTKVITHKCNSCGGPLNVSNRGGKYTCPFCGTINLFEPEQHSTDAILCPQCGAANAKDALFCAECGMKFTITCPKCGTVNVTSSIFCINCGANIEEEKNRLEAEQAKGLLKEKAAIEKKRARNKKILIGTVILAGIFCFLCSLIFYITELSPSARATATAEMLAEQSSTEAAMEQIKTQYPYNGSNGIYSVYIKDFCVGHKDSTGRDYVFVHFLYFQDDPKYGFNWDFSGSSLTDNLGNTFEVTQETSDYGTASIVTDFAPNASSVVLYIQLKVENSVEIPIELDPNDPVLTATCSK